MVRARQRTAAGVKVHIFVRGRFKDEAKQAIANHDSQTSEQRLLEEAVAGGEL